MNKTFVWVITASALWACNGAHEYCQPNFVRSCQCGTVSGHQQCDPMGESFGACSCDTSDGGGTDTTPAGDTYIPPDGGGFDAGDPCAANTTCGSCTAAAACGFCRATAICSTGTASGPVNGSCGSGWAWNTGDCTSTDSGVVHDTGVPHDSGGGGSLCSGGLTACGASNTCTNTNSDFENCGSCGSCCDPSSGNSCSSGTCIGGGESYAVDCTGGLAVCCGRCRDLSTDPMHCGSCGHQCPAGVACVGGCCGGCSPHCGDGVCNGSETRSSCPGDCGTCGGSTPTVTCSTGGTCPVHSHCSVSGGSTYCDCDNGYTATDCSGHECSSTNVCTAGNWSCQLLGCGASNFASLCADGRTTCPVGSTCNAAGTGCVCSSGLTARSCSGSVCSGSCSYPNWWCD